MKRVMTIMGKKGLKKALKSLDLAILQMRTSVECHITTLQLMHPILLNLRQNVKCC